MLTDFFDDGHAPIKTFARARNKTAAFTITQPAGTILSSIYMRNDTANAVTGGVKIGTTNGGTDALAAGALAASAVVKLPPAAVLYSATARTLYVDAVSAWNSAQLDLAVEFEKIDR